jgi:CheY-like chemotaxis protein
MLVPASARIMNELKQKVLVVDDEPCMRKFFKTLLEVDGYHVDTVSSGKEAIARINKGERPDFIILDVLMAPMNGFETLEELMSMDRSVNVIMTSCSNWPSTIAEAFQLGARDYLAIPFEKAELDAVLRAKQRKGHTFIRCDVFGISVIRRPCLQHARCTEYSVFPYDPWQPRYDVHTSSPKRKPDWYELSLKALKAIFRADAATR